MDTLFKDINNTRKPKVNLLGKTFGTLTVICKHSRTPPGHYKYLCKCECGKECIRTGTSLVRSKNSNCGNGVCGILRGKDNPCFRGVGEISAGWFLNKIIKSASGDQSMGRTRPVKELTIDIGYLWDLFLKQDRKCALSGLNLTLPINETTKSYTASTASVDRIDSNIGYVPGNVQWVHKHINLMKNKLTQKYFIEMCKNVANTHK